MTERDLSPEVVISISDVLRLMVIGHPEKVAASPRIPPKAIKKLCRALCDEEFGKELQAAFEADDIVELADAIGDSIYVLIFTAIAYGIPLDAVWRAIAHTNLAKVTGPQIYRDPDTDKILKPPGWKPPAIEEIIASMIPRQTIFCPYCGLRHIDFGPFAHKPHRTHLCVPEAGGCGKLFTLNELVFGA